MLYQDFDLLIDRQRRQPSRPGAELARRTGVRRVLPAILRRQARELPAQARPYPRRGDAAGRIAGHECGEDLRGRPLRRGVQRRRQGLFPQQHRRGPPAECRPAHPSAARRSQRGRSALGVPLQPVGQPLHRAVDTHTAREVHGSAGADPADRHQAADSRAGDDLQPDRLSAARRRSGMERSSTSRSRIASPPDSWPSSGWIAPAWRRCSTNCGARATTSFTSSGTANSIRPCRKAS